MENKTSSLGGAGLSKSATTPPTCGLVHWETDLATWCCVVSWEEGLWKSTLTCHYQEKITLQSASFTLSSWFVGFQAEAHFLPGLPPCSFLSFPSCCPWQTALSPLFPWIDAFSSSRFWSHSFGLPFPALPPLDIVICLLLFIFTFHLPQQSSSGFPAPCEGWGWRPSRCPSQMPPRFSQLSQLGFLFSMLWKGKVQDFTCLSCDLEGGDGGE